LWGQWTQAAPSEVDDRPQVLQSLEYLTPVWTEKTTLKHPGCVDDWPELLALGAACVARTWSFVSLRLHCVSSGTNSSVEERKTLMHGYKTLHCHSKFTTGLTASRSFRRWELICEFDFFLFFAFLCLKPMGLHSCS